MRLKSSTNRKIKEYIIVPYLVKIKSNTNYIHYFSFAEYLDQILQASPTKIEIEFYIVKDIQKPEKLDLKFHFIYGKEKESKIYYERPLLGKLKAKMLIENIENKVRIFVNSVYYHLVKLRMDNVYPPGCNLTDITTIKLLEAGYVPVHSGCVALNNDAILLFAPPDTGKSLTVLSAVKTGYHFVSEDITIIDKEHAYSCPLTSTFAHLLPNKSFSFKFHSFASKMGILSYFIKKPKTRIVDVFDNLKINEKSGIRMVCILERGKKGAQKIDENEAFRKLLIINRNEFFYYKNPLVFAYSYFNPSFNLRRLMEKEEEIIYSITSKADCFLLKTDNPREYIELLSDTLQKT